MVKSTTTILELAPATRATTVGDRFRNIQPFELLILFVLVVLLALCIVVAQVVVQDVDTASKHTSTPAARRANYQVGLNSAFEWGV